MPRVKLCAQTYAREDFLRAIRVGMAELNISGLVELSTRSGIPYSTLRCRMKEPERFSLQELKKLYKTLPLDPVWLFPLIGQPAPSQSK